MVLPNFFYKKKLTFVSTLSPGTSETFAKPQYFAQQRS